MSAKKKKSKKKEAEKPAPKKVLKKRASRALDPAVKAYRKEMRRRERRGIVLPPKPCWNLNGQKLLQAMENLAGATIYLYIGGRRGLH